MCQVLNSIQCVWWIGSSLSMCEKKHFFRAAWKIVFLQSLISSHKTRRGHATKKNEPQRELQTSRVSSNLRIWQSYSRAPQILKVLCAWYGWIYIYMYIYIYVYIYIYMYLEVSLEWGYPQIIQTQIIFLFWNPWCYGDHSWLTCEPPNLLYPNSLGGCIPTAQGRSIYIWMSIPMPLTKQLRIL